MLYTFIYEVLKEVKLIRCEKKSEKYLALGGGGLGLWEGIDWKVSKGTLRGDGNILDLGRG